MNALYAACIRSISLASALLAVVVALAIFLPTQEKAHLPVQLPLTVSHFQAFSTETTQLGSLSITSYGLQVTAADGTTLKCKASVRSSALLCRPLSQSPTKPDAQLSEVHPEHP